MTILLPLILTALLLAVCGWRCTAAEVPAPPDPIHSPELLPDGRVTFRVQAPQAKEAVVALDGVGMLPMTKDAKGIWSATSAPIKPDVYSYSFMVDGLAMPDPANSDTKSFVAGSRCSLLHVPGAPANPWDWCEVPHGVVHHHVLDSKLIGDRRDFYVYTPPQFDSTGKTRYPVLVLQHGLTDDASAWMTIGRANVIMDNLIAKGKMVPMVVVNTLGYGMPNPHRSLKPMFEPQTERQCAEAFTNCLLQEIMPEVERIYHTSSEREMHAITGLSMGGGQSLSIGLTHLDRFAWVGSFSGAITMIIDPAKVFENLRASTNAQIRLLWIACGVDDFLIEPNRQFDAMLKSKQIRHTYIETPGAHTWSNWRQYLSDLLPLLFRR